MNVHQMQALFDAATELDEDHNWMIPDRRANVAGLLLAGPRAHEHTGLLWRDVDLEHDRIEVGRSKTDAGLREIQLLPLLRRELLAHRERSRFTEPNAPVFPTTRGKPPDHRHQPTVGLLFVKDAHPWDDRPSTPSRRS